jgi:DNA-directed RNA polymerase specialized sigma24 family protein
VLRYYDALTVEETAEALGCTPGTVKSQSSKALNHLREHLARGTTSRSST